MAVVNDLIPPTTTARELVALVGRLKYFYFGVLTSGVHMSWVRTVAGRLKSDYRYSGSVVYNNFPWCSPGAKDTAAICAAAEGILKVRAGYPESTLADLYDGLTMPEDLRAAHAANDLAVLRAYGFARDLSEAEVVAALMERYAALARQ